MVATSTAWASLPEGDAVQLQPSMEQRFTSNIATKLLTNWHYKTTKLDDQLSEAILDSYIEMLDPNRSYFVATDISEFQRFRHGMDDALRHSNLTPAFDIYNVYSDRVRERAEHARARLEQPFDFTVDEDYEYDRTEAPWALNSQELDEIWRKRVKNDYLRLKLAGKEHDDILKLLDERYENMDRRVAELESDDIFNYFMNAFAQSIEPHTAYLSPRGSENFEISMKLSLEGIGALLGRESEYTRIERVVPGGPADQDGRLKAGDRVVAVGQDADGKMVDVVGWRVDDVVDLIRGPKDSVVRLEVLPEDVGVEGPSTVIDIVRNEVKLEEQAASSRVIEVEQDNGELTKIGVIDLPVFYLDFNGMAQNLPDYRSSTRDVHRLIDELEAEGVEGLVIDLRNNGGGSLLEATTLTGLFIDRGPVVQVKSSNGRVSTEEDDDPGMAWEGPLAVLVNRYSASASEIFAAAIQDYGRGIVIGEPTFGKGTVQSLMDLDQYSMTSDSPQMGQLKITQAQFFRVNGGSTQNRGVLPDIRFPTAGDPQEYGERSLDNALPWTEIDAASYQPAGDLERMVAVADFHFQDRVTSEQEFRWLLDDIEEYNAEYAEHRVSLLETERRADMDRREAKREERKALEAGLADGPLVDDTDPLAAAEQGEDIAGPELDDEDAAEDEEDDRPDLMLRESARIVADMVELSDSQLLTQQFSQMTDKTSGEGIN
ncbi:tail-specific protease [Marinihelvus fidelis]|uniref:Tail-specific protease n=2 Tax=Marinihelvus fidelis TaxID=2613842 RepID=A0A5N0TAB5_9GAMM|nr:tail-specific protease [Marinihelvus fidelis]